MQAPSMPDDEPQRLQALRAQAILDTPAEERFDRLTRLARHMLGTQIALVSLVDANRQWFKSRQGLDACETGRDISFCGHAILDDAIFEITDASLDPRFSDNPLVTGPPNIRFYAGAPLATSDGCRIGTLCIIDDQPRQLSAADRSVLRDLADCVEAEINQIDQLQQSQALRKAQQLGEVIVRIQSQFIREADRHKAFEGLLTDVLALTESEYGFIGEVLRTKEGTPYLKSSTITNIAWNDATRVFYEVHEPEGMEFANLKTLFEAAMSSGEPVFANDACHDLRRGGLPEGRPALNAFLGIPVHHDGELVAMLGIANRPGGYDQALVDFLRPLTTTLGQLMEAARVKQRYRDDERRLASVIEGTNIGIWEWNVQSGETVFNDRWAEIVGYTLAELQPISIQTWLDLTHPDDLVQSAVLLEEHFAGERDYYDFQCRMRHKEGHWVWVHDRGRVMNWTAEGKPLLVSGTHADITDYKQSEQALKLNESRLRGLFELSPIGIALNEYETGRFVDLNDALLAPTGYAREEFIALNYWEVTPKEYESQEALQLERMETTGRYGPYEKEYIRKDGSRYPVLLNGMVVYDPSGRKLIWSIIEDISERKRMERMKSEFVSTVSHELRTPLTSISGALGLLVGGAVGELPVQAQHMLSIAHKNSLRLTHLINDLLDMEKIAAGKLHFEMQPHALIPLIEQALEANRAYGAERRVTLALTCATPDAEVRVDNQRLMQVLANLLSNAIKFSPEGGTVSVTVVATARKATVSVADHGPGIPAAFRDRIFQKFSQADASDTRQKGGTGLGLAITRELVERMGGSISFDSVEGHGARFFFELPLWSPGVTDAATDAPSAEGAGAPRILVVEDDPDIAQLLGLILTRGGYQVDITGSGAEALAALQQTPYAAVSLDLMLPDISGLEIIRRVRQRPETADLPIVVVSAKMEEGRLAINGNFSGIDWLAKPFDEKRLLTVVERHLSTIGAPHPRVLHIEDDADLHQVIRAMVGKRFDFDLATTLQEARARLAQECFDVVILDLGLPDGSGWDMLPDIRTLQPNARVVILSGTDMTADEARKVETVLLKSQISPRELLDALSTCIRSSTPKGIHS